MIKKAILYIFLVTLCLSMSGIIIDKDVKQINNGYEFIGITQDDNINHYIIVELPVGNVSIIDDTGNAINNLVLIDDGTVIYSAVVASDGYIYISANSGIWKRNSAFTTPALTSNLETDFTHISIDSPTILIAKPGYIYYEVSEIVKRINMNTLLVSIVKDVTAITGEMIAFDVKDSDEMYFFSALSNDFYIYDFDLNLIRTFFDTTFGANKFQGSIQYINDDAIYFGVNWEDYDTVNRKHAEIINKSGGIVSDWGYKQYDTGLVTYDKTFYIGSNAYTAALRDGDKIEIIATVDKGVSIESLPANLLYEEATINSQYTSYYNNSDLYINTFISIDLSDNDFDDYRDVSDLYQYEIDLVDPNGVQVENNIIYTNFVPRGIFDKKAELTSTQTYTGTYINGSWTVNLYEVTKDTNTRALLDDDSFEILNTSSSSAINPPVEIEGNLFDRITNNESFGALIIIVAFIGIFASMGAKQDGDKTITGAFMGFIVGVFVGFMAGLVPLWIVLSMVLVSIGLIASGISNKMG